MLLLKPATVIRARHVDDMLTLGNKKREHCYDSYEDMLIVSCHAILLMLCHQIHENMIDHVVGLYIFLSQLLYTIAVISSQRQQAYKHCHDMIRPTCLQLTTAPSYPHIVLLCCVDVTTSKLQCCSSSLISNQIQACLCPFKPAHMDVMSVFPNCKRGTCSSRLPSACKHL